MFADRRISAGELQARYELKHDLFDFQYNMRAEINSHWHDKGSSWKHCKLSFLKSELKRHMKEKDYVSVANLAFFLILRTEWKKRRYSK